MKLIVIGISGITGGGKTTLSTRLYEFLNNPQNSNVYNGFRINQVVLMHQDKYFYTRDSPHHKWIPEINFINREILSAMDMDKFAEDVSETVRKLKADDTPKENSILNQDNNGSQIDVNILIIEGFLIYNDARISQFCQLRFHIYLSYDVGLQRRLIRPFKHINPKPEWYYEHYIWPMYHKHLNEVPNKAELVFLNGEQHVDDIFNEANDFITKFLIQ
ncbi:nicotinamide riboside kinase 1-like [Sitodiplosis mosellana]|uniref:nicotinamide riboside kinase 1-like n=1 Tax=Sitodiplosis mosellana TaxID=263140 RepID=UPI0024453577|nr:nicotinamide riboside kinase 1-like [Sitodiplosis mosellana]